MEAHQESALTLQIARLIEHNRNFLPGEGDTALEDVAASQRRQRIAHSVQRKKPIELVLPGFPAKSPNREKTLGDIPDLGEVLALKHLQTVCDQIRSLYPPGAIITLCSDGRVFSDLVRVSDAAVDGYARGIRAIIDRQNLGSLRTYNLEDHFPHLSYSAMRCRLVRDFAEPLDAVRSRVKSSASEAALFNGIHRFVFEDHLVLDAGLSRSQIRKRSKVIAYEVIQRSNAWSRLVEQAFPHALRLSIHPQPRGSKKIGIRLLPGEDRWSTPWHAVALFDGKVFSLVKHKQALAMNARLAVAEGRHGYFTLCK